MPLFDRMVIAGVGLIGASLGLAARRRGLVREAVGFGRGEGNLRVALERGAIDRYSLDAAEAAGGADLVVLAVPVGSIAAVAQALLSSAAKDAVVVDVGSVKAGVVKQLEPLVRPPASFVGCHPIAGTEHSGAAHAFEDLFDGHRCILTPTAATDPGALARVRRLWEDVGMRVESMSAEEHDHLLAVVSHLPHVAAFALVSAVDGQRVGERDPLAYSGGGLRDSTRIASSHPEMWRDIFLDNRQEVLASIDVFAASVARIRALVEAGDGVGLERALAAIRAARGRLQEPKKP